MRWPRVLKDQDSLWEKDGNRAPFLTPTPSSEPIPVGPGNWGRQIKYTKPGLCLTVLSNVPFPPLDSWVPSDGWGLFKHQLLPTGFGIPEPPGELGTLGALIEKEGGIPLLKSNGWMLVWSLRDALWQARSCSPLHPQNICPSLFYSKVTQRHPSHS